MTKIFEPIKTKLDDIDRINRGKPRKKIVILGAGMAGLVSAYELSRLGHEVTIYEASSRLGGRVWTQRFSDGQYNELGAMRIPKTHDHTRYYAKNVCNLDFRQFVNHHSNPDTFYHIKGITTKKHKAFDKLISQFDLTHEEKEIAKNSPLKLLSIPLVSLANHIEFQQENLEALFGQGKLTEKIKQIDKVSLGDFLKNCLHSQDAFDLIGAITGLENLLDNSLTMFLRHEILQQSSDSDESGLFDEIVGGFDKLPITLASKLASNVIINYNHEVLSLIKQEEKAQIIIRNTQDKNNIKLINCDYIICTIPFSILRKIEMIGWSEGKKRAIENLSYASATKVLLHCRERFWESKYSILGGASQTDLINRSIYYPSDNFKPISIQKRSQSKGLYTSLVEYDSEVIDKNISKGSGVLVGSYSWGEDARKLGSLPHKTREELVKQTIANFHPEIMENGMVDDSASMFWDEYKWAGGAFSFMKPGDFVKYYADTISPERNLFFAGEHCSLEQGWIQGAITSALRAIKDVVSK